jgi:hypothetical protein
MKEKISHPKTGKEFSVLTIKDVHAPKAEYKVLYVDHALPIPLDASVSTCFAAELVDPYLYENALTASETMTLFLHRTGNPKAQAIRRVLEEGKSVFAVDMEVEDDIVQKELDRELVKGGIGVSLVLASLVVPSLGVKVAEMLGVSMQRRQFLKAAGTALFSIGTATTLPLFRSVLEQKGSALDDASIARSVEKVLRQTEEMLPGIPPSLPIVLCLRNAVMARKLREVARLELQRKPSASVWYPVGARHYGLEQMLNLSDADLDKLIAYYSSRPEVTDEMRKSMRVLPEFSMKQGAVVATMHTVT